MLTQTKCEYLIDLLSKRSRKEDFMESNEYYNLEDWFYASKVTCEVLVANMINPDMMNHIFFQHYKEVTQENTQKLLRRVDQLYFARTQAFQLMLKTTELDVYFLPKSQFSQLLQQGKDPEFRINNQQYQVCMNVCKLL